MRPLQLASRRDFLERCLFPLVALILAVSSGTGESEARDIAQSSFHPNIWIGSPRYCATAL